MMNNYGYMPYQQPMMYQQSNPYLDRINNLQQYQQTLQPQQPQPGLASKIVDSFDNINVNDVPMGGQAVFIKNDGSEIQVRAWGKMGNIEKTSYKPFTDVSDMKEDKSTPNSAELNTEGFSAFTEDFSTAFAELKEQIAELVTGYDKLNSKLDKLGTTKTTTRTKKESEIA